MITNHHRPFLVGGFKKKAFSWDARSRRARQAHEECQEFPTRAQEGHGRSHECQKDARWRVDQSEEAVFRAKGVVSGVGLEIICPPTSWNLGKGIGRTA